MGLSITSLLTKTSSEKAVIFKHHSPSVSRTLVILLCCKWRLKFFFLTVGCIWEWILKGSWVSIFHYVYKTELHLESNSKLSIKCNMKSVLVWFVWLTMYWSTKKFNSEVIQPVSFPSAILDVGAPIIKLFKFWILVKTFTVCITLVQLVSCKFEEKNLLNFY